ncbi:hypothetical protein MRB53_028188 [Persea americana]|uniref:Uncharacterized protein n=1 Tax=Persea americana TaxID=3435 RepID=A0ACC2KET1_PERAE|nr:hypothetical protein MRB53_028188 [Persea americana]
MQDEGKREERAEEKERKGGEEKVGEEKKKSFDLGGAGGRGSPAYNALVLPQESRPLTHLWTAFYDGFSN